MCNFRQYGFHERQKFCMQLINPKITDELGKLWTKAQMQIFL